MQNQRCKLQLQLEHFLITRCYFLHVSFWYSHFFLWDSSSSSLRSLLSTVYDPPNRNRSESLWSCLFCHNSQSLGKLKDAGRNCSGASAFTLSALSVGYGQIWSDVWHNRLAICVSSVEKNKYCATALVNFCKSSTIKSQSENSDLILFFSWICRYLDTLRTRSISDETPVEAESQR